MRRNLCATVLTAAALLGLGMAASGDHYTIDPDHSCVVFRISHSDLNWIHGRFNKFSGEFIIDPNDASRSTFTMKIEPNSVDTNNTKRDGHLRSPDFFNAKQFPEMGFRSTSVRPVAGGLEVEGDFTMHGRTKPVHFTLKGGKTARFKDMSKTGYTADFAIKRSEFGMDKFPQMLGDDVYVTVSFQGIRRP